MGLGVACRVLSLALCLAFAGTVLAATRAHAAVPEFFIYSGLTSVTGLAIDGSDNLYVLDGGAGQVKKFSPSGQLVASWGSPGTGNGQFNGPSAIAVDPTGTSVYVADTENNRIQKFDAAGNFLAAWGGPESGCAAGSFSEPLGISTDSAGNVYVADTGHYCIQVYTPNGLFLRRLGTYGSGPGQFPGGPTSVAIGPSGEVYAGDAINRVQVFSPDGSFLRKWGEDYNGTWWSDLVVADAGIYVANGSATELRSPDGELLAYETEFRRQTLDGGLAVDAAGQVYGTWGNNVVMRVDPGSPAPSLEHDTNDFHGSPYWVFTDQQVPLDASDSHVWFGSIAKFEWDLDGNGSFELDTGTTPRATTSFGRPGSRVVQVRVTSTVDKTAVADFPFEVFLRSPPGPVGITINRGEEFTNDPRVTLRPVWGDGYWSTVTVSNYADFHDSVTFPVAPEIPWTLLTSGSEQVPKTVYGMFDNGFVHESQIRVQRGVVLDQTAPTTTQAEAARTSDGYNLLIKASDATSGVETMQIAADPANPPAFTQFTESTTYRGAVAPSVRVRDRAGNVSGWTQVRLLAAQPKPLPRPRALCRNQSKKDPPGKRKSHFIRCVAAMKRLAAGKTTSARKACRRLPKASPASKRPSPRKRCVRSGKKLLAALAAT